MFSRVKVFLYACICFVLGHSHGAAQVISYTPPRYVIAVSADGGNTYAPYTAASGIAPVDKAPPYFVPVCSATGLPPYSQCNFAGSGSGTVTPSTTAGPNVYGNTTSGSSTIAPLTSPQIVGAVNISPSSTFSSSLIPWSTPGTIGSTTPNTASFTTLANSGQATSTAASAASTPARLDTGTLYTGGTTTTTTPHWYLNQGASVTSWLVTGTMFGMNAPSGFTGRFLDFHVNGGNALFAVNNTGAVVSVSNYTGSSYNATNTAGGFVAPLYTPASSSATCTTGTIAWDANYIYICTATNTFKRIPAALATF